MDFVMVGDGGVWIDGDYSVVWLGDVLARDVLMVCTDVTVCVLSSVMMGAVYTVDVTVAVGVGVGMRPERH